MSRIVLIETSYLVPDHRAGDGRRRLRPSASTCSTWALALVFGVIGYIAHKTNYHVAAILIGVMLGPLFEKYLVRALRLSEGDPSILFSSTLGNVLWALLALSLLLPAWRGWRRSKQMAAEQFGDG